jgi:catabolite regulation protein CreA
MLMPNARQPKLFDLVAVLNQATNSDLEVGDVGTVVELLPPDGIEVEFLQPDGRTRCVATLGFADVLVLNRQRTKVA